MAFWSSISFQNFLSSTNSQLESLHDLVMVWLLVVIVMVLFISAMIFLKNIATTLSLDSAVLEVTWTIIPILILITVAVPSLRLLCMQDTISMSPGYSMKLISNQWNWQTDQKDFEINHVLDMEKVDELSGYENPVALPSNKIVRILLTSTDVLHSLGMPALALKLDSAPGRLNAVAFEAIGHSLLTGSCYELCGSGHSAMPIYMLFV